MNPTRRFGAFSSSIDPNKLSETVESALKVIGGILLTVGIISTPQLNAILGQVGVIVPAAYALWNAGNVLFGAFRKIVVLFTEQKPV